MIEISIEALARFGLGLATAVFSTAFWFFLWIFLAFVFEYPNQPSWRSAVPAAAVILFITMVIAKVIVFV